MSSEKETKKTEHVTYAVLDKQGKESGTLTLDADIFACQVDEALVHETVVWQLAKRRAGTASAMTKAEVSGGGKKPHKQKGTGQARAGSNTSPLWVGGGVIHGPKPRDYTTRLPKRTRLQALCSVLSDKVAKDQIRVLDKLVVDSRKTKDMGDLLKKLKVAGEKVLMILEAGDQTATQRAARNIPGVLPVTVQAVNVYDLLKYKYVLTSKNGIEALQSRIQENRLVVNRTSTAKPAAKKKSAKQEVSKA